MKEFIKIFLAYLHGSYAWRLLQRDNTIRFVDKVIAFIRVLDVGNGKQIIGILGSD